MDKAYWRALESACEGLAEAGTRLGCSQLDWAIRHVEDRLRQESQVSGSLASLTANIEARRRTQEHLRRQAHHCGLT